MAPPLLPLTRLVACSSCAEHVKSSETVCPHCGAELRGARVARTAGAVLMGLALSGCPGKDPEPTGGDTETGTSGATAGETDTETGTQTGSESDSEGTTTNMPEPEYGVPVTTSGEQDYGVPATDSFTDSGEDPTAGTDPTATTSGGEPLYGGGAT